MNSDDFFRELTRSPGHAPLSSSQLEDMAKRASSMFLLQDTPLTDAVVKVASDCRGISSEQVKRVVEMTNQSTFQNLFEKTAGERNVHFDIADPNEVLRQLNSGASAPVVKVASQDYGRPPPSASTKDLEADLALCEVFGVEPSSSSDMTKSAMIDPARGQAALELFARNEQAAKAQKKVIETLMQPPPVAPAPSPDQLGIEGMTQGQLPPKKPAGMPGMSMGPMPSMPKMAFEGQGYGGGGMGASGVPGGGMASPAPVGGGMAGTSAPPVMDDGGVVPGEEGERMLIDALPGEVVVNPEREGLTAEEVIQAIQGMKEEPEESAGGSQRQFRL